MTLGGRGRTPRRSHLAGLVVAMLVTLALTGLGSLSGVLGSLERASLSTRYSLRHVPRPAGIVVVKIDDESFDELATPWPFPRSFHARAIDKLHAAGAKEIVYDVQFTEPSADPKQDEALYRSIGRAGGAILATSESDAQGRTGVLGGDANLAKIHARAAAATLATAPGGVITSFPYQVSGLKSLAVAAAERARGTALSPSRFDSGKALIDYQGGIGTFPEVSFWRVLRGSAPAGLFRGKIVVVGATAPSLQDLHATPTSGNGLMAGPEVQANAIWTALHGNPLRDGPGWLTAIAVLLAALVAPLAAWRLSVVKSALIVAATAGGYLALAQVAFDKGLVVVVTTPLLALTLGGASMLSASYFTASSDRRLLGWTVRRRTEQLRDAQMEVIARLVQAAESRDGDTGDHINRIGDLCERLALEIGIGPVKARMLRHASAMHDVGKIGIPDSVLLKPGKLDSEEWEIMRSHTTKGAEILAGSRSPMIQMAETIARTHHERWDGTGYPNGLKGEEIPLEGRICAICDVYDALGSARPYKQPWTQQEVLEEIARGSGTHFDPAIVTAFLALIPALGTPRVPTNDNVLSLETLPPLDPARDQAA
jgi:HD-GYP domain-containing protein (c-di-GMP phosphodiesterase class II)